MIESAFSSFSPLDSSRCARRVRVPQGHVRLIAETDEGSDDDLPRGAPDIVLLLLLRRSLRDGRVGSFAAREDAAVHGDNRRVPESGTTVFLRV